MVASKKVLNTTIQLYPEKVFRVKKILLFPSTVSSLRIVALPFLFCFFNNGYIALSFAVFFLCGITDLIDGYATRKLKATSKLGAFIDATADFILIIGMFLIFTAEGFYPFWIPLLIVFMFVQFIFSSLYSKRLYDPVGKYYGSILYAAVAITLAFPIQTLCIILAVTITGFTVVSVSSRIAYFRGILPKAKMSKTDLHHP